MNRILDRTIVALWALTTPLILVGLWMVFFYVPDERVMGAAQRIFYFHVPAAMVTYAGVLVMFGASVAYLWTRDLRWDDLSRSATEVSVLFCSLVLISGPIWAKPAWGVWWTWEARLTTTLLLWLLLVAALMVRSYSDNRELGARLASIVGIVAALDVPIIKKAVDWWRGQHPTVFKPGASDPLTAEMSRAFQICTLGFLLLFLMLLALRYRLAGVQERTESAHQRILAGPDQGA